MAAETHCLFCRIIAGDVPSVRVHEDERTVAFMDIAPATRGHLLVVPRAHADDVHDIDHRDLAACATAAQRLAGRLRDRLGADGINLLSSSGEAAWQSVRHFHMHVIPRYAGDPLVLPWTPSPADADDLAAAGAVLRD